MNETAYERVVSALRATGKRVVEMRGRRDHVTAQCPAHNDNNPSLGVTDRGDRALIVCRSNGCDVRDIVAALDLTMADLFNDQPSAGRPVRYVYDDGRVVKRSYKPDGKKHLPQENTDGMPTLFHASRLADVPEHRYVYLVEGEEDVLTLEANGAVATTAPMGAQNFDKVDVSPLADKLVVCVVDRDEKGDQWAAQVHKKLRGVARDYKFVRAATGNDTSDHFAAGHDVDAFEPYTPPGVQDRTPADPVRVRLTKASGIAMKGTRWAYRGRIPHGMVTLLAGREGIGKSTVSLDIAARLTRGTLPGRYEGKPQNVIVCATEDSWSHTIVPRLMAVGADMDRVFHIAVEDENGNVRGIVAPGDIRRMEDAFEQVRPALMLIDPLMAVIDGKIDTHKQSEVQQALEPLVKLCDRLGMAVLALIHVNKTTTTDPLTSIMGSKAFATLPRSILYCLEEDEGRFMLCHPKCNVGPKMPSIGYRLQAVRFDLPPEDVEDGDDPYIESSRVIWGDEDPRTASELMEEKAKRSNLGECAMAVLELIDNELGAITSQRIRDKLTQYDTKAIENALARLTKTERIARIQRGTYQSIALTP